ncbi:predicted protein [Naegleria gruberi]|uniref:Predicted protein n=1 Tax=Naegleria gruberi TaxID=5762 RepID=D2W4X4_NAEGR|nr:uncharacterized protein NAEGRDRAFT_76461 [Naegleria gruberi]EFC35877.1 predicted protein [Naegleria gruberi]|eukprot:XP_002668621.1 predicted protein [Naegleria gruberi strain NEG-M]
MPKSPSAKTNKPTSPNLTKPQPPFKRQAIPLPENIELLSWKRGINSNNYISNGDNFWSFRFEDGLLTLTNYPMRTDDDDHQVVDISGGSKVVGKLMTVAHVATDPKSVNQVIGVTVLTNSGVKNLVLRFGDLLTSEFTKESGFDRSHCKRVDIFVKHWNSYLTEQMQNEGDDEASKDKTTPSRDKKSNPSIFDDEDENEDDGVSKQLNFTQEDVQDFNSSKETPSVSKLKIKKKPRASLTSSSSYVVKGSMSTSKIASIIVPKTDTPTNKKDLELGRTGEIIKQFGFPASVSIKVTRIKVPESSIAVREISLEHVKSIVDEIRGGGKALSSEVGLVEMKVAPNSSASVTIKNLVQKLKRENRDEDAIMEELQELIENDEENIELFVHGSTHYTLALTAAFQQLPQIERTSENTPRHDYYVVFNIPDHELLQLATMHNTNVKQLAMDFPSILINVRRTLKFFLTKYPNSVMYVNSDGIEERRLIRFVEGGAKLFKSEIIKVFGLNENSAIHYQTLSFWSHRCWDRLVEIAKTKKKNSNTPLLKSLATFITKVGSCKGIPEEEIYYSLEQFLNFGNIQSMVNHINHTKCVLFGFSEITKYFSEIPDLKGMAKRLPNIYKALVSDSMHDSELKQVEEKTLSFTSTDLYLNIRRELSGNPKTSSTTDVSFPVVTEQLKVERNGYSAILLYGDVLELANIFPKKVSYDLMICDLPYGVFKDSPYDVLFTDDQLKEFIDNLYQITPDTNFPTWIFFGEYKQIVKLQELIELKKGNAVICIWVKNGRQFGANFGTYKYESFLLCFPNKQVNIKPQGFSLSPFSICFPSETNFLKDSNSRECNKGQKPLSLISWLVYQFSNVDGIVLDLCSGTATTAVAAVSYGRNSISLESNHGQFEHAAERLKLSEFEKVNFEPLVVCTVSEDKEKKEKKKSTKRKTAPTKKTPKKASKKKKTETPLKGSKMQSKKAEEIAMKYIDSEAVEMASDEENVSEKDEEEDDEE